VAGNERDPQLHRDAQGPERRPSHQGRANFRVMFSLYSPTGAIVSHGALFGPRAVGRAPASVLTKLHIEKLN
jgi:hypothetical protein